MTGTRRSASRVSAVRLTAVGGRQRQPQLGVRQHVRPVGERDGQRAALLDEQDRHAAARGPGRAPRTASRRRSGRARATARRAAGRRAGRSAPGDRELLLLPPESEPALRSANSRHDGEEPVHPLDVVGDAVPRPPAGEAEPQVLGDGQRGEDMAALRDERDPGRATSSGPPASGRPCSRISPAAVGTTPHHRVQRRRLPRAVRPDQADDLAPAEHEADAAHGGTAP